MSDCALCGLPTPDPPISSPTVEGQFCCEGCLAVAEHLDADEPDDSPARMNMDSARVAATADPEVADGESTAGESTVGETTDGEAAEDETTLLHVDGMHCTACETFVEGCATDIDGVEAASASYPTGALAVTYDPAVTDVETLPDRLTDHGYEVSWESTETDEAELTGRILVGAFFGMLVMLWYAIVLYPSYLDLPARFVLVDPAGPAGAYVLWQLWVVTAVVLGYTGRPILRGALVSLRTRQPNMDLLVALAATTAFAYSTLVVLLGGTEVYFDVTTVIVLAVTLGGYVRDRYRAAALGRLESLTDERPDEARRVVDDGVEVVPPAAIGGGDLVVVAPGERIPVDGVVREGDAAVDASLVTGESIPGRRTTGDPVAGGALVTDGRAVIEAAPGGESTAERLVETLWSLRAGSGGVHRLVDRLAVVFVPVVFALAAATVLGHLVLVGTAPTPALLAGLAVLVVSCPCALGLATPLAITAGVRDGLDRGIVLTGDDVLERAPQADVVVFDKTGTLTTGEMTVVNDPDPDALRLAAALEADADHPIARAIVEAVGDRPDGPPVDDVETVPGRGVRGTVAGERALVGSPVLFESAGWTVPEDLAAAATEARANGQVPALIGWGGRARGLAVAGDEPRAEWATVVERLASDREVFVLTGDGEAAAAPFRDHEAIDEVFATVPPEGKAAVVERLRRRGTVAVVGDGSNDAPALAAADVGVALAHGTALAAEAADAVIVDDDLTAVPEVFALTRGTRGRIRQNLGWALTYNAVAVPLAVAGVINPLLAAVAMATSSVLVVSNSARPLATDDA